MEKMLKQNEIDALFEAARSSTPEKTSERSAIARGSLQLFHRRSNFQRPVARHQHAERFVCSQSDAQSFRLAAQPLSGEPGFGRTDSV